MAYTTYENSVDDGAPYELFEFRQGSNFWRYTSSANDVVKSNETFSAEYIKRDEVRQVDDIAKGGLKVTLSRTNEFASSFLGNAPEGVTTLTIWRAHFTDGASEYVAYWKGRLLKTSASGSEITLDCESIFSSLKRPGLRARYERSCRHSLYNARCTLSMSSFQLVAYVSGADGIDLVIADASAQVDGYYTGGVVMDDNGSYRLITKHVGTAIRINRRFAASPGNTNVTLYPGCDKAKATCISKFNNLPNFGGFPFIPTINPFGGSSII